MLASNLVTYPWRALHESSSSVLLLFILWFGDGASHAGRDLFTIFAAFPSVFERLTKADCPRGLEPSWKSTPAVKVQADNSRMPRSNSPIFVPIATDKTKERGLKKQKHVFVFLSRNWRSLQLCHGWHQQNSSPPDSDYFYFGLWKHGAPSKLQLSHSAVAQIKSIKKIKIVILQISRRATANYPQSNSSPTWYTVTNIGIVSAGRNALCRVTLRLAGL